MFIRRIAFAPATDDGLAAAISAGIDTATPQDVKDGQQEAEGGDAAADTGADSGKEGESAAAARGGAAEGTEGGGAGGDGKGAEGGDGAGAGAEGGDGKGKKPGEGGAADEGAEAGDGRARDEHGRFVKGKTPEAGAAAKPGADGEGKGKPAAKAPDHVNDPIPDEIKGRTKERLEGLITIAKNAQTELTAATTKNSELMRAIGETGTNPQQFGDTMDILGQINSRNAEDRKAGVAALRKMADAIALELGETPPGKDPLEGHADLQADLEEGTITKERAIELATARNREKAGTRRTAEETAEQQHATAVQSAKTALNSLEEQLKAGDPQYGAKRKLIEDAFRVVCQTTPPAQWAGAYQRMYSAVKLAPAAAPTNVRERVPGGSGARNPARPAKPAQGGGTKTPASIEEAIDFGLEQARNAR